MKSTIKKIVPPLLWQKLKKIKNMVLLKAMYRHDRRIFLNGVALENVQDLNLKQLEAKMMFEAHAIEKGLSHTDFRPNFGRNALEKMNVLLSLYNEEGFDKKKLRYKICLSALKNYQLVHDNIGISRTIMNEIFSESLLEEIENANFKYSGVFQLNDDSLNKSNTKNFKELSRSRVSVRSFSEEDIDDSVIKEAVEISLKTPSVCNRQPYRVTIIKNQGLISQVLKLQNGFNGFKIPPVLFLVTSSTSSFIEVSERNQGYIDGGLFSMSLLYALEYVGLASCPLNAMMNTKKEAQIRQILDVPEDEVLIMFIAVGKAPKNFQSPLSYRDSYKDIARVVE